jgi:hypothetical protein
MIKIWVDDIRYPPEGWLWCPDSASAIGLLETAKRIGIVIEEMSLDHDLGGDDTSRPIVLWCCENDWWPVEVRCHSSNPPGREWIEKMIERYLR